ncbi:MAG TPA: SGNH hydrolase domain-containing protein [Polyangiaceae bacterium]|nr:SGNH hydrolase domain-containing protein [Polyangiaceae bacterium]
MIGGRPGLPWSLTRLYEARPVQWLGELSYSLYLWHWPLYVLAPLLLPLAAGAPETAGAEGSGWRFGVLVASLGWSWLTHRFIEEPVRRGRMAQRPAWQSYVAALVATALLGGVLLAEKRWLGRAVERGQPAALAGRLKKGEVVRCFGAASAPGSEACRNGELEGVVLPRPEKAKSDRGWTTCMVEEAEDRVRFCETGSPAERASRTVLLVGDSHAEHWLPALDTLAPLEHWRILRVLKSKCSLNEATPDNTRASQKSCAQWNAGVHAELARHPEIREVFVSASAFNAYRTEPGVRWQDRAAEGYVAAWSRLPASIERIWVIRDLPRPRPDVIDCLARLGEAERARPGPCARPRSDALLDDPLLAAARREPRARVIDLSERFCDQRSCYPMIGHSIVYRDKSHLGATFARTLAPHLERALESAR